MLIGCTKHRCVPSMLIGWVVAVVVGSQGRCDELIGSLRLSPQAAVVRAVGELLRGAGGAAGVAPQPGPAGAGRRRAGRRRRAPALPGAAAARLPTPRPAVSVLSTPQHPPPPPGHLPGIQTLRVEHRAGEVPQKVSLGWHHPSVPGRGARKQWHRGGDRHHGGVALRGDLGLALRVFPVGLHQAVVLPPHQCLLRGPRRRAGHQPVPGGAGFVLQRGAARCRRALAVRGAPAPQLPAADAAVRGRGDARRSLLPTWSISPTGCSNPTSLFAFIP